MTIYNGLGKINNSPLSGAKTISSDLVSEISKALHSVDGYGSIEIYVQDNSVTQITVRNIKKTKHTII